MTRSADRVSKSDDAGKTHDAGLGTSLAVHSGRVLGDGFQGLIATRLASVLRGIDSRVERVVVRFEDLNGPKGGDDTSCRIQVAVSGRPGLVVEARADGEAHAFRLALHKVDAALNRRLARRRAKPRASLRLLDVDAAE